MKSVRVMRRALEPFYLTILIACALVAGGFVLVLLGWHGAARHLLVPFQMPFLVSGGLAGLALIGIGLSVIAIQLSRARRADERRQLDEVLAAATDLLALTRTRRRPSGR